MLFTNVLYSLLALLKFEYTNFFKKQTYNAL